MKRLPISFAMAFAGALFGAQAASAATPRPVPELLPQYAKSTLSNGITLLLLEHHELPVVNFEMTLRTGSIADPAGKEGLADVTLSLLRKGTATRTSEQIADELDFLGGELGLESGYERCAVSANFLAKDVDRGLALLADMLLHPSFPEAELQKLVDLNVNGIRDLKDNPRQVIGAYYEGYLFAGHPLGRPVSGTETSLPAIQRADVQQFYTTNIVPNATILAVVGDFNQGAMKSKIEKALGSWKAEKAFKAAAASPPTPASGRKVLLVDKPDATQSYFRIGNVGVAKGNPDEAPLDVVNTVFGGRFTSWLSTELRIKSGLSYNASSAFVERRVPGPFYIASFTRVDSTARAMDLALEVLERLHQKGLSDAELESARNYIRGQYPPDYETPGQLAAAMTELEFFGLDRDYINRHTQKTDAVSLPETKRVIEAHYPEKDLAIVLIGPAAKLRKVAPKYGTVTEKSIAQPGF